MQNFHRYLLTLTYNYFVNKAKDYIFEICKIINIYIYIYIYIISYYDIDFVN